MTYAGKYPAQNNRKAVTYVTAFFDGALTAPNSAYAKEWS